MKVLNTYAKSIILFNANQREKNRQISIFESQTVEIMFEGNVKNKVK